MPLLPLLMNLRQRCQAVFQAGYKVGEQSFRSLAAATKLSKSSVHRQYPTWQLSTQQALQEFGFKVKYFVSDRAKALVKLALNDLGCPSIADLFHALFELSKSLGWELNC